MTHHPEAPTSPEELSPWMRSLLPEPRLLTVHLSLNETKPLVWRRLALRWDLELGELHRIIQLAMG